MQKYLEKFVAIITKNKRVFVFALPFVILFSVFPPAHADAFAWIPVIIGGFLLAEFFGVDVPGISDIVDVAAKPLLEALLIFVNIFVGIIAALLQGIYIGMGNLLHAVINYFVAIPVVPSPEIGFVQEAWNFSLLFVNALFLLILVFIGLATILRLHSYQLQRTLPLLIIVALLVNFSGVLVGFVVDISNIITNFFLGASTNAAWWADPWLGAVPVAEKLGQNIARILYYPLGILIYFIVMLLFGVRVMILWTLTILAPLAFAALILPATKSLWTKWWSNLIQWSIIGIPISFFLFLSGSAMNAQLPPATGGVANVVFIFAPLTSLFLLFIGITLSMQLAPAGAQGMINFGKKWGMRGASAAGTGAWRRIRKPTEAGLETGRKKGQEISANAEERLRTEKLNLFQRAGLQFQRFGGRALSTTAGGLELGAKEISMRTGRRDEAEVGQATKDATGKNPLEIINSMREELAKGPLANKNRLFGYLQGVIKNGDVDDVRDAIKDGRLNWNDIAGIYKQAEGLGTPYRRLMTKGFLGQMDRIGVSQKHQDEIWNKITSQDIQQDILATDDVFVKNERGEITGTNDVIADQIVSKGAPELARQILQRGKKEERQAFANYLQSKDVQWYLDRNREDIVMLSTSDAAAAIGMAPIGGLTRNQAQNLVKTKKIKTRTDEELRGRKGRLEAELAQPQVQNKRALQQEIREVETELELRIMSPGTILLDRASQQLSFDIISQKDPDTLTEADYRNKAVAEIRIRELNQELKRRRFVETPQVSPEDQPLSVQIARLREKGASLKEQAKLPYRPGEIAREELKKIGVKIKELEKRGGKLPTYISTLTQNEVGQHRQDNGVEIEEIDSELAYVIDKRILAQPASPERAELMRREEELKQKRNLVMLEQRQLTEAYLIKIQEDLAKAQNTKQLIERKLKEVRERKKGAEQGSTEEQAITADEKRLEAQRNQAEARVGDLTRQEKEEYDVWQQFANFERQQQPELDSARELAEVRTAAQEAQKKVLQLRTAKAATDTITEATRDLRAKKREQGMLERKLTAQLAMNELQGMIENTRFYPHPRTPGLTIPPLDDLLVKSFEASIQDIQEKEKLFEVDTASLPRTEQDRIEREKTAYLKETEERRKRFKEQIEQAVKQEKKI